MPNYVHKRRRKWYAALDIPVALRGHFQGKPRFVRSLDTTSRTVALLRADPVVRRWQADLAAARELGAPPTESEAAHFRRALREAKTEDQRMAIIDHIYSAADAIGYANVDRVGEAASSDPAARQFFGEATGSIVSTLEHLDEWLAQSHVADKTKDMHRAGGVKLAAQFPLLRDVDKPGVRRWVTGLMGGEGGLAPKTVQRVLSGLRGYWRYLQDVGVVSEDLNPFDDLAIARQPKRASAPVARQAFEPAAVVRLLAAAAIDDPQLADLIRLAMWTGCRIEELCALKMDDVLTDSFRVIAAKTEAGVRVVPIHDKLAPTLARLMLIGTDEYVLSGLTFNKYGDRSNAVGKRFGRLKTELGFGPAFVFHSIRRTVVTILENEGVSENTVADIVGHEKPRITYGLYSGGATLEVKRAALAKLSYPG